MLTAGQYDGAWQAAHEAYLRAPNSSGVKLTYASVWFSCLAAGRTDWEPLLNFVNGLQADAPFEEQSFLIELSLLASRTGVGPAQKELQRGLDSSTVFSEPALLQMAGISEQYKLGLTAECLACAERDHHVTPSLAYMRAVLEPSNAAGLATFETLRAKADNPQLIEWRLNWARYLDRIGDPRASAAVLALTKDDAAADDVRVQQFAMNAGSMQTNREVMWATLARVRRLLGERNIAYRTASGRFWLQFEPTNETEQKQKEQAVGSLLEVAKSNSRLIEPHAILGAV